MNPWIKLFGILLADTKYESMIHPLSYSVKKKDSQMENDKMIYCTYLWSTNDQHSLTFQFLFT